MPTSNAHIKAQYRIADILDKHYEIVAIEYVIPTPNPTYVFDDGKEFLVKPFQLDVFAESPREGCKCKYKEIGIEVDSKVGHDSKYQTIRDEQRTKSIEKAHPGIFIHRYRVKELFGRGYFNPKTKQKTQNVLTSRRILTDLGIKCTHI